MASDHANERERVGLCAQCVHVHIVENRRGSRFFRCRLADVDPAYPRYPGLPVLSCAGFAVAPSPPPVDSE